MSSKALAIASAVLMVAALYMVFIYVPTEQESGIVQRVFYFHVPLAWVAFLAFFIVFLGSILFLVKQDHKWDVFSTSSAEVGLVFTTLVLISGSIWAKPTWGVWWTWDPRLTTSLILWIIYVAYFLIRSFVLEEERRNRFAAVVGIIGFVDVPIVFMTITLARTQHPGPIIFEGGLVHSMIITLVVCIIAFTVLYTLLFTERMAVRRDEDEVKRLKSRIKG
jgi:heme exporter protein C